VRAMNDAGFSSDDERWPLMAVLTWIATRSLKLAEKLAFSDPTEAGQFLFETRKVFGAPCQISYSASFHSLNEKIESRAIVGSGSKIKWTVAPAHSGVTQLALAASSTIFNRSSSSGTTMFGAMGISTPFRQTRTVAREP
jgi:hypothetical protein